MVRFAGLLICLRVVFCMTAHGAVWYVQAGATGSASGVDWENAYVEVQHGVDAASDGDTVIVGPGVYSNEVRDGYIVCVDKEILLKSSMGRDMTTILGPLLADRTTNAIRTMLATSNSVVDGFTLRGGNVPVYAQYGPTALILSATIRNCIITEAKDGTGAAAMTGDALMEDCILMGNTPYVYALVVYGGGTSVVNRCIIYHNYTRLSSIYFVSYSGKKYVYNTVVAGNGRAASDVVYGVRVHGYNDVAYLEGCIVEANPSYQLELDGRTLSVRNSIYGSVYISGAAGGILTDSGGNYKADTTNTVPGAGYIIPTEGNGYSAILGDYRLAYNATNTRSRGVYVSAMADALNPIATDAARLPRCWPIGSTNVDIGIYSMRPQDHKKAFKWRHR